MSEVPFDCDAADGRPRFSLEQAQELLIAAADRIRQAQSWPCESRDLKSALEGVLAESICAPIAVPRHANSAMDGYAFRHQDLAARGEAPFKVVTTWLAGVNQPLTLGEGECVRIMTGAAMPTGADTVVPQESVTLLQNDLVQIPAQKTGAHVRAAGEDIPLASEVFAPGVRLGPAELGVLASLGLTRVQVARAPRVAYFTSGDELRDANTPAAELPDGCIYDSNRYTLFGMLKRLGIEAIDMGILPDDPKVIRARLTEIAPKVDLLLTCGGVSVGEADFVTQVLTELGQIGFWKVAIRPGRPFAFGQIGSTLFCGLPGNPVAAMVTFYALVRPLILRLMGAQQLFPGLLRAQLQGSLNHRPGRVEYQRGQYWIDEMGQVRVSLAGDQGSGRLTSMTRANCFILIAADAPQVQTGDWVSVIPFYGQC